MKSIEVTQYNPAWPEMFKQEAHLLKQAVGNNFVDIHHVGSTAVKGLAAKPIIDIILVVHNISKLELLNNQIQALGYKYKGEYGIPFRLFFQKGNEQRTHHLHVYELGNPEIELNVAFRDYLRKSNQEMIEYSNLKYHLLSQEISREKVNSKFTGYNLGKDRFIHKALNSIGFNKTRLMSCIHYNEWKTYHRIKEEQIFAPVNVAYDRNHSSFSEPNHFHFVLYQGVQIIGIAHIEFLNDDEATLRSLAVDKPYKGNGYGTYIMKLIEKWIKYHKRHTIKMHARNTAKGFYRKLGYVEMNFEDESIQKDYINLGKVL